MQRSEPALSPDASKVAWQEVQGGAGNIFVATATGGAARQVTTDGRAVSAPVWSPRGEGLAFMVRDRGAQRVAVVAASGGVPQVYLRSEAGEEDIDWAPDDRILYQRPGNHNFNFLDPRTEAESALVRNPDVGWIFHARVSPDRRWAAVNWNRYNAGVWIVGTRDTTQRLLLERGRRGMIKPVGWTSDSRAVFVRRYAPDDLVLVPITGGPPLRTLPLPVPGADCAVRDAARGLLLACAQDDSVSDAWLLTRRDARAPARTP